MFILDTEKTYLQNCLKQQNKYSYIYTSIKYSSTWTENIIFNKHKLSEIKRHIFEITLQLCNIYNKCELLYKNTKNGFCQE